MGSCVCVCWCATWGERSFAEHSYRTSLLTLCPFLFRARPERSPLQDSTGAIVNHHPPPQGSFMARGAPLDEERKTKEKGSHLLPCCCCCCPHSLLFCPHLSDVALLVCVRCVLWPWPDVPPYCRADVTNENVLMCCWALLVPSALKEIRTE